MAKTEKQGLVHLLQIAAPYALITAGYAVLVLGLEEFLGDHIYKVSGQIGSVFGLAVAFFLGFRMNSAYDRWWEARKIFGELTNNTRSFAAKVYAYYGNASNFRNVDAAGCRQRGRSLLRLAMLYARQMGNDIQGSAVQPPDEATQALLQSSGVNPQNKVSNELLLAMAKAIEDDFAPQSHIEKSDLMQHLNRFYEVQGKAERIKNTPFLMIYSAFTKLIVSFYVILIPLFIGDIDLGGEGSSLEYLAIPIMVTISSAFLTINRLANLYGDPFSRSRTSIPVDSICTSIEQNCAEVLSKMAD